MDRKAQPDSLNRRKNESENNNPPTIVCGNGEKILLVDDDVIITKMLEEIFDRLGYQVSMHLSSVNAFEEFKSDPGQFDLVFTDYYMPEMNGLQLAQGIKAIRPAIPIIMCTGYSHMLSDEKITEIGIKSVLHKPVRTPELAATIRNVLDDIKVV